MLRKSYAACGTAAAGYIEPFYLSVSKMRSMSPRRFLPPSAGCGLPLVLRCRSDPLLPLLATLYG